MADEIDSLTDELAIRAVKLFYDIAPPVVWEGGHKMSTETVKTVAAALVREAPTEVKPVMASLADDSQPGNTAARAAVCRLILRQAKQSPVLQPHVERAIETARQPHMAIDPATGVFIIMLLLATSDRIGGGRVIVDMLKALPKVLHELPDIIKALPQGLLSQLATMRQGTSGQSQPN